MKYIYKKVAGSTVKAYKALLNDFAFFTELEL